MLTFRDIQYPTSQTVQGTDNNQHDTKKTPNRSMHVHVMTYYHAKSHAKKGV